MATSGTTSFSVSRDDIITEALALCGIQDPSIPLTAADITTCSTSLNVMCKAMVMDGLPLWAVEEVTVPMVLGQASYQLGPTATGAAAGVTGITMTNNGNPWNLSTLTASDTGWSVAYNGTVYCAVQTLVGNSYTSTDGITWTPHAIGTAPAWNGIAWNGSVFCAVAASGPTATSTDGISWSIQIASTPNAGAICFGNGLFVVPCFTSTSTTTVYTSPDGVNWTTRTLPVAWGGIPSYGDGSIVWNGSIFCMIGLDILGNNNAPAFTSPDGINWTAHAMATALHAWGGGLTWTGSKFIALAGSTNGTVANISSDGVTWSAIAVPSASWSGITSNGNNIIAVGNGTNALLKSIDGGTTWFTSSSITGTVHNWSQIIYAGSKYVAISGEAATSTIPGTYALTFTNGSGTGVSGTYTISPVTGQVSATAITTAGSYTVAPNVSFNFGGIIGATGTVVLGTLAGTGIVADRPLRILQAYIRDSTGNDTILTVESRYEYNINGQKTSQSTPNQLFYDPQLNNGIITVFGTPPDSLSTIHLVIQRQFQDFNLSTDNPDFPQEGYLMLSWGLADMVSLKYRVPRDVRAELAMKAKIFKDQFFAFQQDYVPIQITPGESITLDNYSSSY